MHTAILVSSINYIAMPFLRIDQFVFQWLNRVSTWLQKELDVSRYALVLGAYAAALVAALIIAWFFPGDRVLLPLLLLSEGRTATWCWGKLAEDEDRPCDAVSLEDKGVVDNTLVRRLLWTVLILGVFTPNAVVHGDPWVLVILFVNIGNYWVGSDHVPPRLRRRSRMGWHSAFGT